MNAAPAITSDSTTTFTENTPGTFTVVSNGEPTASLSESGPLPSGVSFNDNGDGTATLSGTPATGTNGTYPLTITASNGVNPDATQTFALVVDAPSAIISNDSTTFTAGTPGSFTVTTTGNPTAAISESGSLPSGVSFTDDGDGTATLSGTAAVGSGGLYPITITAGNGVGTPDSQIFTLTVDEAPGITSPDSTVFTAGSAGTFTVTTSGYPVAALSESGTLPSGVSFNDNGDGTATLSGTPDAGTGGSYVITITAANGVGSAAGQSFTLTVDEAPAITSANAATFVSGHQNDFTVTTTGTPTASIAETGSLPDGVTLTDNGDGTATLSGNPAADSADTYTFTITATNVVAPADQTFTLTIDIPAGISSPDQVSFARYSPGSFTVTTTGNPTPSLTEVGTLPKGMTYSNGTISGTPTKVGTFELAFLAANGIGFQYVQYFTLTVTPFQITTTSPLPAATEGTAYSVTLTASGGVTPYKWKPTGTLPAGLTLSKAGVLSGTVADTVTPGTYQISVKVKDSKTPTAEVLTATFSITVNASD